MDLERVPDVGLIGACKCRVVVPLKLAMSVTKIPSARMCARAARRLSAVTDPLVFFPEVVTPL